jgi:hypothetical protein
VDNFATARLNTVFKVEADVRISQEQEPLGRAETKEIFRRQLTSGGHGRVFPATSRLPAPNALAGKYSVSALTQIWQAGMMNQTDPVGTAFGALF